jgi:microcystin-dependent protein
VSVEPTGTLGGAQSDVAGTVAELARLIKAQASATAAVRIGVVTAVQASPGRKVQTDQTGTAWVARLEDTAIYVGDRVAMLQQSSLWLVIGRLTGEPGAVPIGTVVPFAGSTAPPGWLECAGQAIDRTTYATLYQAIGNGYGAGNGTTTFNIPNLQGRVPVGAQGLTWFQTSTGGAATVALSTAEMPAHNHGNSGNHEHGIDNAAVTTTVNGTGTSPVASHEPGTTHFEGGHTHTTVGSGAAHENMPPYLVLMYIIRVL